MTHNVTHPEETSGDYDDSGEEPDPSMLVKETIIVNGTWTTLDGAREGWTYYVEIVPENCLGNGTAASTLFSKFNMLCCNSYGSIRYKVLCESVTLD